MANKREVKKNIKRLNRVKTWQLLVLLILSTAITLTLLRLNNIGMLQHRNAVLSADKSGDTIAIANALVKLQQYSAGHMNADTGPFYLENTFKRDFAELYEKATAQSEPTNNVNSKADAVCRPQFTVYSQAYTDCFVAELAKYPPAEDPSDRVEVPDSSLYRHEFISPMWSPDFAGLGVVISGAIALLIAARLITVGILHLLLKRRYSSI